MADRALIAKWRLDAQDATSIPLRGDLIASSTTVNLPTTGPSVGMVLDKGADGFRPESLPLFAPNDDATEWPAVVPDAFSTGAAFHG